RLEQLQAIAKRVEHVHALESFQRLIRDHCESSRFAPSRESRQSDHEHRRVRFPGGPEIGIDPEMQPQRARAEPDTAAYRQVRWFGLLGKTQNLAVERPRLRLLPGGHGQLHVIEGENLTHKMIDVTPRN